MKGLGPKSLQKLQETGILAREAVVDSLIRHFGGEFIGRETLTRRQQILSRLLQLLIEYADAYKASVIFTNQVRANPSPFRSPTEETGGNILAYGSTYRIRLRAIKGKERRATIRDAPDLSEEETPYYLTDIGLVVKNGMGTLTDSPSSKNGEEE